MEVFVPFLGDLFSIHYFCGRLGNLRGVFVPFLGDLFFQKRVYGKS